MSDVLVSLALVVLCLGPGFACGWASSALHRDGQWIVSVLVFVSGGVLTYTLCESVLYPMLEVMWR